MNPGHEFVGLGGDDAGADHDLAVWARPVLHEPGEGEEALILRVNVERLLRLPLRLPLVEAGGGDDAPLAPEGRAEGRPLLQGLGPGVDGFREYVRVLDPARD